jgi:hypothetical protein
MAAGGECPFVTVDGDAEDRLVGFNQESVAPGRRRLETAPTDD